MIDNVLIFLGASLSVGLIYISCLIYYYSSKLRNSHDYYNDDLGLTMLNTSPHYSFSPTLKFMFEKISTNRHTFSINKESYMKTMLMTMFNLVNKEDEMYSFPSLPVWYKDQEYLLRSKFNDKLKINQIVILDKDIISRPKSHEHEISLIKNKVNDINDSVYFHSQKFLISDKFYNYMNKDYLTYVVCDNRLTPKVSFRLLFDGANVRYIYINYISINSKEVQNDLPSFDDLISELDNLKTNMEFKKIIKKLNISDTND
ncbi:hypothetical protein LZF95_20885 [Algoriphagus sp. AGSA1]|uniref:hypothetical protein n=1 Tax=Algoriphagus sp. AGSA1 TaxID=2907213 RepID=UPI001F47D55B|nr:hypothetical protein [Algoriphagus sp. AGSA1]MCE7057149.1 hypothetical protein [Algoriphagus sp. AGSA1]